MQFGRVELVSIGPPSQAWTSTHYPTRPGVFFTARTRLGLSKHLKRQLGPRVSDVTFLDALASLEADKNGHNPDKK